MQSQEKWDYMATKMSPKCKIFCRIRSDINERSGGDESIAGLTPRAHDK